MQDTRPSQICYVVVQDFICGEDNRVTGILGYRWPRGETVRVFMDLDPEFSEKARRVTFADLKYDRRLQTEHSGVHRLEAGGVLRLRLFTTSAFTHEYTTDSPTVVTWNRQETENSLAFGYGGVQVLTPHDVRRTIQWLQEHPRGQAVCEEYMQRHPGMDRRLALEGILAQRMEGENRYTATFHLYNPDASICGSFRDREQIRERLHAFFQSREFAPRMDKPGNLYRPVRPKLLIRHLTADNRITSVTSFMPNDAEDRTFDSRIRSDPRFFLSPEKCAARAMEKLAEADSWDILPCRIYSCAPKKTRLGVQQNFGMLSNIWQLLEQDRGDDAESAHVPMKARKLGLILDSAGTCTVQEVLYDHNEVVVVPELLAHDQQVYGRARPRAFQACAAGPRFTLHSDGQVRTEVQRIVPSLYS